MFGFWGTRAKATPKSGAQQRKVILVVEDDPALLEAMSRHLTDQERYSVLTADNYQTGVKQLSAGVPHIACIDLGLPSESGYEVASTCAASRSSSTCPSS